MTGDDIKAWRTAHNCTQERLAKHLGIQPSNVSLWEKGFWAPPKYGLTNKLEQLEHIFEHERMWCREHDPTIPTEAMIASLYEQVNALPHTRVAAVAYVSTDVGWVPFDPSSGRFPVKGDVSFDVYRKRKIALTFMSKTTDNHWTNQTSLHKLKVHRDLIPEYVLKYLSSYT